MGNFFGYFMVIVMGLLGGVPTIFITLSLPVIIVQKIIRKVKYGKSLYD